MKKVPSLLFIALALLTLAGCLRTPVDVVNDKLEQARVEARDKKRIADAYWLITSAELYRLSYNKTPAFKDDKGTYRSANIIKGSSDYENLFKEVGKVNKGDFFPVDSLDPDRFYVYYSDGDKVTVTVYLENEQEGCKLLKEHYCEFVKKNY